MLSAEIIAIGSELLTPEKTDTNGLWLTEKLNSVGVEVMLKTIVGDDEPRLLETIKDALKRSDIVITTGGLGPTEDDITRETAAKAVERPLVFSKGLEDELRRRFHQMGRVMPEINRRQAYVIEGARTLPNPNGSAVGMFYESDKHSLVSLPGPPREMQPMFLNFVLPRISDKVGDVIVKRRILRVSGMGESAVDAIASPIYNEYKQVRTAILFNKTEVEIHLYARYATEDEADAVLEELARRLSDALGIAVFTTTGETMEEVVGKMLKQAGERVSVAESCTGGLIARRFTEVSGSSAYFMEGVVSYSNESKTRALGVPASIIESFGAVSSETAEAMAVGMRERAGTDHSISVTGVAGPDGGTDDKPVGTVFIGYAGERGTRSVKLLLPGDRYLIRWRTSQAALDYLRRQMLKRLPK